MRKLLAPEVTSRDGSTSTMHTESLRPPQTHSSYKSIIPCLIQIAFIPL